MPSLLSRYRHHASASAHLALPLIATCAGTIACSGTPAHHSLLIGAGAWAAVCAYATTRKVGDRKLLGAAPGQRLAWIAGGLLALAAMGESAVDGWGVWWAKGLLPAALYVLVQNDLLGSDVGSTPESPRAGHGRAAATAAVSGSRLALLTLTVTAAVVLSATFASEASIALGLANAVLQALAFGLVERARSEARNGLANGASIIYSTSGLLAQPTKAGLSEVDAHNVVVRDVAFAGIVVTGAAALTFERFSYSGFSYRSGFGPAPDARSVLGQTLFDAFVGLCMIGAQSVSSWAVLLMIQQRGAVLTSFVPLSAATLSQLYINFSLGRLWFAALCAAASAAFLDENAMPSSSRIRIKSSRILSLIAIVSLGALAVQCLLQSASRSIVSYPPPTQPLFHLTTAPPPMPWGPLAFKDTKIHPIDQLVRDAGYSWQQTQQAQSKTLNEAVIEYKRRYGIPPPPNFDKWYAFAKRKGVQLIDEYDSIYHSLMPFWALPPATIRARTREALGFDNMLLGLSIRDGTVRNAEGGEQWMRDALFNMTRSFVEFLPDMDLPFNIHDEPRVVVPHDQLSKLVRIALDQSLPRAGANPTPRNAFSARPADVNSGRRMDEYKTTRFNVFAHQPTWLPSRLSCSPDSPARTLIETEAMDNLTSYAVSELGFVYNQTAFSDICNSPSLATSHGFFDRPNAFNVVHDLFPIFSQSKMSSFQDILYPSPWYWASKVDYDEKRDVEWEKKNNHLYWRGSTTGGFSRDGGWRRQHRQHMIQKLNAPDTALVLDDAHRPEPGATRSEPAEWHVQRVERAQYATAMDVLFSHVGQCDPGDCDAQREFFRIAAARGQQEAWAYRYLLDMDGNAFSGRFYAFLRSRSLPLKMALFREWHEDWLRPWVHFVPLSLRADDALEVVRFLSREDEGKLIGARLANEGRDWAQKALRNEDLEAWFFRLLLEYGRLVDDNRAVIGFAGS